MSEELDMMDVSTTYFGLPIDEEKLLRVGCEDMECNRRNKAIMRKKAIEIFRNLHSFQNDEVLYCSTNAVMANQIKDYYGVEIFPMIEKNISGWFFFLDEEPFANWKHECRYFFIIDERNIFEQMHEVGISDSILMEVIKE